jgi:hypothetical protein
MGPNGYTLWAHEKGTDRVDGANIQPVRSYFETPWFGGIKNTPPDDRGVNSQQLEPDFIQTGDMEVSVIGTANARAPINAGNAVPLKLIPATSQEQFVSFVRENHRLSRLHIESNVTGGSYIAGKNILHADTTEPRKIS